MEKIAIVGSAGAGKTTLSRALGSKLKIKVYHMDRLFWLSGWKRKDRDTRIDTLQNLVHEQRWIIEGTYINSSKLHLVMADTIIFLDIFPLICLLRIIKRHFVYRGRSRRDIPMGSSDRLTVFSILKVLFFPFQGRIKLEINLRKISSKKVIRLHSVKEVERFLAQFEMRTYEKRQFSHSTVEYKDGKPLLV